MSKPLFIMVSPARNEEKFLPRVIESVNKSSIRPALWVIVDDNSTDETPKILKDASNEQQYIKTLRLNKRRDRSDFNYSYVCKTGFDYAIQLSQENEIDWKYIALLDADTIVEHRYFEHMIFKMEKEPEIGLASGDIYILENGKISANHNFKDRPSGTARIWRKNCFNQTGGYSITQAADSVSNVKANLRGWKTVRFQEPRAYQLRETYSAKGLWKGYKIRGKIDYYFCVHPFLILNKILSLIFQSKFYLVIPYFKGYLESMIRKEPRTQDEEMLEYCKRGKVNELLSNWSVRVHRLYRVNYNRYAS